MAICYSCRNIRIGDNNDGDTLIDALGAVRNISQMLPSVGYQMLSTMIPQAKRGGACESCLSELRLLQYEVEKLM